ncbi:hypothetical protein QJQ45_009779 [Haematococcus lacustris]|nr:hypothetical protein QJQ45_009779 [Haematococcus lacustris]
MTRSQLIPSFIVTFAALVGFMRPVRLGTLGLILLTYASYATESVSLMPSLILLSTLGAYILFFDPKAFAGKPAGKTGKKQGGAAKANTAGAAQPAAQATAAQAKKAGRRDVKKLYDI